MTRLIQPETAPSEFSGLGCAGSFPVKIYFRITQISHRRLNRFRYTRKWCFDKHYPTVHEIELQCVIFDRTCLLSIYVLGSRPTSGALFGVNSLSLWSKTETGRERALVAGQNLYANAA